MIKLEFPAHDRAAAAAFGVALTKLGASPQYRHPEAGPYDDVTRRILDDAEQDEQLAGGDVEQAEAPEGDGIAAAAFSNSDIAEDEQLAGDDVEQADDRKRDEKGVPFNETYCANAKDPFYATGKRKGQWKRKKGAGESEYDRWYSDELRLAEEVGAQNTQAVDETAPVNTGAAFGAEQPGAADLTHPAQTAPPASPGAFMTWTSEQQAAGRLTQDDLGRAYGACNLTVTDLFGADAAAVTANVQALYTILAPIAAAA